jgi:hypothetical protein
MGGEIAGRKGPQEKTANPTMDAVRRLIAANPRVIMDLAGGATGAATGALAGGEDHRLSGALAGAAAGVGGAEGMRYAARKVPAEMIARNEAFLANLAKAKNEATHIRDIYALDRKAVQTRKRLEMIADTQRAVTVAGGLGMAGNLGFAAGGIAGRKGPQEKTAGRMQMLAQAAGRLAKSPLARGAAIAGTGVAAGGAVGLAGGRRVGYDQATDDVGAVAEKALMIGRQQGAAIGYQYALRQAQAGTGGQPG